MRLFKFQAMSIINTLREKMGRLVVIVVGLSIMAFVLTDLLGPGSSLMGGNNDTDIGEIDGETITQREFAQMVEGMKQNWLNTYGYPANEVIVQSFRNQVWEQLINEIAYTERFKDLSILVGDEETYDMVQGNNISPQISQNPQFHNPQTGTFDLDYFKREILGRLRNDDFGRLQWAQFQSGLVTQRVQQKFENVFVKADYVTLPEAIKEYRNQVSTINVDYVYVPYGTVNDSLAPVTDAELRAYLNENKDRYQVEESRSIEYVSFPIVPSAEDTAVYKADIDDVARLLRESKSVEQDSLIGIDKTEEGLGFSTYDPGALPVDVVDNLDNIKVGDVLGPKLTNGVYSVQKLSGIVQGEDEFVHVSHILRKVPEGADLSTKNAVRAEANRILREARNGADFAELARKNSEDGSAASGGDLGWYTKGKGDARGQTWVEPFETAAFSATRKGVLPRLVETEFGYHIFYVHTPPNKDRYQVATVLIEMTPSVRTENDVYREVGEFMSNANDIESFKSFASEKGFAVFSGTDIAPNANSIGRLTNQARNIITWLYGEASLEDVKDFELGNEYVVAVYTNKVDEGTAELENVRLQIEPLVRNEKKLAYIKEKMAGLSGSLSEMATAYGPTANFYSAPSLKMNEISLPNVGGGIEALGAAFGLSNPGERTPVMGSDTGAVLIELKSKSEAAEIADYTSYMTQIQQRKQANDRQNLRQSIREAADIVDERHKVY